MQIAKFYRKHENKILALAAVLIIGIFVGLKFDYFYQANDDVYIKNLLSGVYTGTPESHNIQMHYPLSLLLSVLYRIAGNLPVYGLFLCICQYGCCYLLLERSLNFAGTKVEKFGILFVEGMLMTALLLPEFVFLQYTVTSAILAGTAVFRFYTADCASGGKTWKEFLRDNIGNILLVVLAFCVRSEMLLLVFPFICLAGFLKWTDEKPVFTKENTKKYFSLFGLILAGIGLAQAVHMIAYSGPAWKNFTEFFDARTELYDYQFIPDYKENCEFYETIGLNQSEQKLLENYNFGLDEKIDSEVLRKTAEYAQDLKTSGFSFQDQVQKAFEDYKYKTFHAVDFPWNVVTLASYALLFLLAWKNRRYGYFWKIPLLAAVRTGLWMFIMVGNRYPDRITHSLYFVELLLLAALLFGECRKEQECGNGWQKYAFTVLTGIVFMMIALSTVPVSVEKVSAEMNCRENANRDIQALDAYCRKNASDFYFVDVYSTVSDEHSVEYSEKVFQNVDNSPANYDLMGGWVVKSPATDKKYEMFGFTSMEDAILDMDNVYVIMKKENSAEWMEDYYRNRCGVIVEAVKTDSICVDSDKLYTVYKVTGK